MFAISSDALGRGDDVLGRRLMVKFIQQLLATRPWPHAIAFYNSGVHLLSSSSVVLDALKSFEADGVDLIACGTCLDHFKIRSAIAVGRVSDMREIVGAMAASAKVIIV